MIFFIFISKALTSALRPIAQTVAKNACIQLLRNKNLPSRTQSCFTNHVRCVNTQDFNSMNLQKKQQNMCIIPISTSIKYERNYDATTDIHDVFVSNLETINNIAYKLYLSGVIKSVKEKINDNINCSDNTLEYAKTNPHNLRPAQSHDDKTNLNIICHADLYTEQNLDMVFKEFLERKDVNVILKQNYEIFTMNNSLPNEFNTYETNRNIEITASTLLTLYDAIHHRNNGSFLVMDV